MIVCDICGWGGYTYDVDGVFYCYDCLGKFHPDVREQVDRDEEADIEEHE